MSAALWVCLDMPHPTDGSGLVCGACGLVHGEERDFAPWAPFIWWRVGWVCCIECGQELDLAEEEAALSGRLLHFLQNQR